MTTQSFDVDGMTVVVCEAPSAPVVAVQVWVGAGSADEREPEGGLAHVHEHMLFKGTARRGVGEIAAEIEGSGGEINAWTSYDQTVYHVVMAKEHAGVGIDVLADAISNSAFDEGELTRELEVILEEIRRSEDMPMSRTSRALFELCFDAHPYRRPVIGRSEVVEKFSRDDVVSFFDAHYKRDRITVVVAGDIATDEAVQKVREAFAHLPSGARPNLPREKEPEPEAPKTRIMDGDVEEATLAIGFVGPSISDKDLAAIDVLSVIMGRGESSRLMRRVQRELQLANRAYAYAYTPRDAGLFVVGAGLNPDKLHPCIAELKSEILRAQSRLPSPVELQKAKTILCSESVYQQETVEGLAQRLGYWSTMLGDESFESRYQKAIRAVSADDVMAVATRYLAPHRMRAVCLVPTALRSDDFDKALTESLLSAAKMPPSVHATTPPSANTPSVHKQSHPETFSRRRTTLSSGATLIVEEDPSRPIVAVRATWLGGTRGEAADKRGVASMMAELLPMGAAGNDAETISSSMDAMAGQLDSFAGRNSIGLRGTFLSESFDQGFRFFHDALRSPDFDQTELDRMRRLVLEELRTKADQPAALCFELFQKSLFRSHPYRASVLGTKAGVESLTRDDLRKHFEARLAPQTAVVSITGDMTYERAVALAEETFATAPWTPERYESWRPDEEPAPTSPEVVRFALDRQQAHVVTGVRGLKLDDPDRFALEVLIATLSGQGGRLFLELRDKQSLCYSVSAFSVEGLEPGTFAVYMGTSPHKVPDALKGIEEVLQDVRTTAPSDAAILRAQRYLIGTHSIGLQRLGARGSTMSFHELYGLDFDEHLRYAERISAVDAAAVMRVAERVLGAPGRVTAIVGPEDTSGPAATMEVTDLSVNAF